MAQPVSSSRFHAGTWVEGSWKRNMEERVYSLGRDAVTTDPLLDPMIDRCGHTYNRQTWFSLDSYVDPVTQAVYEDSVRCPVSRARVRLDSLSPNLHARSTVEYLEEHARMFSSSSSRSSSSCSPSSFSTSASTMAPVMPAAQPVAAPVVSQSQATLDTILSEIRGVKAEIRDLKIKNGLQHRQITNFLGMTYCDRAWSLINCRHMSTVAKRGFTNEEWRVLHTPITSGTVCQTSEQ